jgi:hypothetical protein
MPRGAKPGERRGGRAKGTPNKITFMKTQMAMKAMAETDSAAQLKATEMLNRVMAESYAMAKEYGPQSPNYNDALYKDYLKLTVYTAGRLAPYQAPQLLAMRVGSDRDSPLMIREGVTSKQVLEMLRQKIMETGLLPTMLMNGGGMESQSG